MRSTNKGKTLTNRNVMSEDICVCCGEPVPEGRMICWNCEYQFDEEDNSFSYQRAQKSIFTESPKSKKHQSKIRFFRQRNNNGQDYY